jgi:protein tyrosine phosphatase (PTP) superfamily phosphohydrolase (DUF442 family)
MASTDILTEASAPSLFTEAPRRMAVRRCIDPSLTVGGPPGLEGMRRLAWEGFSAVLDMRTETPGHRILAQEAEAGEARKSGLVYLRQALTPEDAGLDDVYVLLDQIRSQARPLFVFCDSGEAALLLGLIASDRFSSANEVFTRMSVWGSPLYNADLSRLARAWFALHGVEPKPPRSVVAYD